jgi:hypothetical protein
VANHVVERGMKKFLRLSKHPILATQNIANRTGCEVLNPLLLRKADAENIFVSGSNVPTTMGWTPPHLIGINVPN